MGDYCSIGSLFCYYKNEQIYNFDHSGGRGRIRTDERTKRADLQSASFSHLDTLPKIISLN